MMRDTYVAVEGTLRAALTAAQEALEDADADTRLQRQNAWISELQTRLLNRDNEVKNLTTANHQKVMENLDLEARVKAEDGRVVDLRSQMEMLEARALALQRDVETEKKRVEELEQDLAKEKEGNLENKNAKKRLDEYEKQMEAIKRITHQKPPNRDEGDEGKDDKGKNGQVKARKN